MNTVCVVLFPQMRKAFPGLTDRGDETQAFSRQPVITPLKKSKIADGESGEMDHSTARESALKVLFCPES